MTDDPELRSIPFVQFDDARVAKVMAHPLRKSILGVLEKVPDASVKEIATALGMGLEGMSYHVRELTKAGLIELTEQRIVRGAVSHRYRIRARPWLGVEAWEALPHIVQSAIYATTLDGIFQEAAASHATGGMDRAETVAVRLGLVFDEERFLKASEVIKQAMLTLEELSQEPKAALKEQGGEPIPMTAGLLLYGTPDPRSIDWTMTPLLDRLAAQDKDRMEEL